MEPKSKEKESNKQIGISDDAILDQVLDGKEEAFNLLIHKYRDRIYNYAFYLLHSSSEAEDVTQETFVRAFMNLSKFRREASFHTWLYRIASNVAYQFIGKLVRQRKLKEKMLENKQHLGKNKAISTPEDMALKDEMQQIVFEGMQKLRPKHREVLILKEINGLEVAEVARICNVPQGTIKSRLNRARLELKKQINRLSTIGGELKQ